MFVQVLGSAGMVLILLAYYLVSSKKVSSKSAVYHAINLFGSLILAAYTFILHAWPAVVLNLIWAGIAISALFFIWRGEKT